jgi:FKBP-type peptidyl-prolyl cis-trans isomerase SlyD
MEISKDTTVVIEYTLKLEDGSVVKGKPEPASINFITGYGQVMPALEQRLLGRAEGEKLQIVVPAEEAFGPRKESLVKRRTFDEFPEARDLEPGRWVIATNDRTHAKYSYFVKEKNEEAVVLDFNHPLAGKDLYYDIKITGVRPASGEELKEIRPCEYGPGASGEAAG